MHGIYFLLIISAAILTEAAELRYPVEEAERLFEENIRKYGKQYKDEGEKHWRFEIFKKNLKEINAKNANSEDTAVYGINQFSDMTDAELEPYISGISEKHYGGICSSQNIMHSSSSNAPDSFDWRDKNVVSPVRDQQNCVSGWAFSATGHLESQYAIKHKKMISVSEQQLLDCDTNNMGCTRGFPYKAFFYAIKSGLMSEDAYPYTARDGTCRADPNKAEVKVSACTKYFTKDEDAVKEILYSKGPLSVCVCSQESWFHYAGGILKDSCTSINHAVLLVGYGSENGTKYWILKNSWSDLWGEHGYIKIERGTNCCGILVEPLASADIE